MPEWKLKAKLARNTIFDKNYGKNFCPFWVKIAKRDYFGGFQFSQAVLKSHTQ